MKKLCMFCMKEHRGRRPALCAAKGEVMRAYAAKYEMWQVLLAIRHGQIKLEEEAHALLAQRKKA